MIRKDLAIRVATFVLPAAGLALLISITRDDDFYLVVLAWLMTSAGYYASGYRVAKERSEP